VPEGFKETEIGPIPVDWAVVRLVDVFEIQQGKALSRKKNKGISPCHFLRTANVLWGQIDLSTVDQMDFTDRELNKYALKPGDLLTCEGGEIGRTAIWQSGLGTYCYQNHLHRLRSKQEDIEPLFYMYWMQAAFLVLYLYQGAANVTTIANLSRSRLSQFALPKPPLPEQRHIAHVLGAIQQAIAAQDDLIAAAREVKRSLMQRVFTYGPGAEPALTKETEFGVVPEHWEIVPLETCAFVQTGATKGRKLGDSRTVNVPYLRVANVQDGYLDLSEVKHIQIRESEIERYSLQSGDVVLTEGGDFDKLGRGFIWRGQIPNCTHQNHIFAVRPNRERLLPEYLAYLVQSDYGKSYFLTVAHRTTHLACINKTKLQAFPTLVAALDEQERIASLLSVADRKIEVEAQRKAALQALFETMLHQLMTGQIRLGNRWDSPKERF
jgi:type I restriction enzyme S subunit